MLTLNERGGSLFLNALAGTNSFFNGLSGCVLQSPSPSRLTSADVAAHLRGCRSDELLMRTPPAKAPRCQIFLLLRRCERSYQ